MHYYGYQLSTSKLIELINYLKLPRVQEGGPVKDFEAYLRKEGCDVQFRLLHPDYRPPDHLFTLIVYEGGVKQIHDILTLIKEFPPTFHMVKHKLDLKDGELFDFKNLSG